MRGSSSDGGAERFGLVVLRAPSPSRPARPHPRVRSRQPALAPNRGGRRDPRRAWLRSDQCPPRRQPGGRFLQHLLPALRKRSGSDDGELRGRRRHPCSKSYRRPADPHRREAGACNPSSRRPCSSPRRSPTLPISWDSKNDGFSWSRSPSPAERLLERLAELTVTGGKRPPPPAKPLRPPSP